MRVGLGNRAGIVGAALALLVCLGLGLGCPYPGGVPSLWWLGDREIGSFTESIERNAATPEEENLIAIAEAVYPPREDVIEAYCGSPEHLDPDEPLWWYCGFDGVRIPYAITGDAVDYYSDLVHEWRDEAATSHPLTVFWLRCNFEYGADIEYYETYESREETFSDVYVVMMRLHWSAYCGPVCAHAFDKYRIVVLTPEGEVLAIFGDGTTSLFVS